MFQKVAAEILKRKRAAKNELQEGKCQPSTSAESASGSPPDKKRSIFGQTLTQEQILSLLKKKSSHETEALQVFFYSSCLHICVFFYFPTKI
jgi:hypothetical protein